MTKTKTTLLTLALFAGLSIAGNKAAGQRPSLDMKTAIELALSNNYSLKADSMDLLTADYQKKVVKADLLPQISYISKTEANLALPSQMLPGSVVGQPSKELVPVRFGTRYAMGSGIEVNQALIRKSTKLQLTVADVNTRIARTKLNISREELVYQVAETFYSLQNNAALIQVTGKDYRNLQEIVRIAQSQYENGVLKRIDFETLQINAANKESQLNQLESAYVEQLTYFKYLLGLSPDEVVTIDPNSKGLGTTMLPGEDLLKNREDIRLSEQLIQSKDLEIQSIKAEKKPVVNSYFRFNYQSQFNDFADGFKNDYLYKSSSVGITTSITLFDGRRRKSRTSIAESQLQQLKFRNEQQQQLARTEWISANETMNRDQKNYQIARQNLVLAEKVFDARKALYAEGVTTLVELLDAESDLSNARNLEIQALINVQSSVLKLHKATGTLLTAFINTL